MKVTKSRTCQLDINNRADIEKLVASFYASVKADKRISYLFGDVYSINWETHLPLMVDFWENVLFFTGNYDGSPIVKHRHLQAIHPTSPEHFEVWIQLFDQTINTLFKGENAEKIKAHAKAIANIMQHKI